LKAIYVSGCSGKLDNWRYDAVIAIKGKESLNIFG
jgi:hypothetical protein